MTTLLTNLPSTYAPRVTLDCTASRWHRQERATHEEQFLEWVRNFPRKDVLHVYLTATIADRESRFLKNKLQALGCTVTARVCCG
ncbi:MAG: hypothetical protein PHW10_00580 [Candidatus Peribacteraceae bacterium]|nr:hypothetical protein [Candidatus Peribacteraceae bacterium]